MPESDGDLDLLLLMTCQITPGFVEGRGRGKGRRQRTDVYNMVISLGSCKSCLKEVTNKCARHPVDFPTQTVKIPKRAGVGIRRNTVCFCQPSLNPC